MHSIKTASADCKLKNNSLEIRREKWLRQLMADPEIEFSYFRVATVIGWHMNRSKGAVAWPGINTIASIACIHRTTVMRATDWLEQRGHLSVTRSRKGKRNLANHYRAILQAERKNVVRLPSSTVTLLPSSTAMRPEPYTEPLTEPHIPIRISDAPRGACDNRIQGREESGIRERDEREESTSISDAPSKSLPSLCFDTAVEHWGVEARAVVGKALNITCIPPAECLADIVDVHDEGGTLEELAMRLWRPTGG
jgi:hypothetical protein